MRKKIRDILNQLKDQKFFEKNKILLNEANINRIQFFIKKEKIIFLNLCNEKVQEMILKYKGIPLERLIFSKFNLKMLIILIKNISRFF